MISFRYHLVTIVAVFLALSLGLLGGTTVLDGGLVQRLKDQTNSANQRAEQLQTETDQLSAALSRSNQFAANVLPAMEQDRLVGNSFVIVGLSDMNPKVLDSASAALKQSGARIVTTLSVTGRVSAANPADRAALAQILNVSPAMPRVAMTKTAAEMLGERLSAGAVSGQGPGPAAGASSGTKSADDLLLQLLDGGFIVSDSQIKSSEVPTIGGDGQIVLVLAGGPTQPAVQPEEFLVPLVQTLLKDDTEVAAGESAASVYEFVTLLRSAGVADGQNMVTVDDIDEPVGGLALTLGLHDQLISAQGGDFGFKRGAGQLYPQASP